MRGCGSADAWWGTRGEALGMISRTALPAVDLETSRGSSDGLCWEGWRNCCL